MVPVIMMDEATRLRLALWCPCDCPVRLAAFWAAEACDLCKTRIK